MAYSHIEYLFPEKIVVRTGDSFTFAIPLELGSPFPPHPPIPSRTHKENGEEESVGDNQ